MNVTTMTKKHVLTPILVICIIALLFNLYVLTTPYMMTATAAYLMLVSGLFFRKTNIKAHATLMSMGIFTDIALVLILEVQRSAINTAVSFTLTPMQQMHIVSSTIATVLYFPTLFYGFKRLKNKGDILKNKKLHKRFAIGAFMFRTIGLVLMFTLLDLYTKKGGA